MNEQFKKFVKGLGELLPLMNEGMSFDMTFYVDGIGGYKYTIQSLGFPQKIRIFDHTTGIYYRMEGENILPFETRVGRNV